MADDLVERLVQSLSSLAPEPPRASGASGYTPGGAWILDPPAGTPAIWGRDDEILWAERDPLVIAGGPGVGKTTIASQLVLARTGLWGECLGLPVVPDDRPVLYLASDRPAQAQRVFRRLVSETERDHLDAHLVVWKGPPAADFAADTDLLHRMCEETGAGTVVLDSLKDMAIGLSDDAVGASVNQAIQRVINAGIDVVSLHHLTKTGSEGTPTLNSAYGSIWLTSGAGSVVVLQGQAGADEIKLHHLKFPIDEVGPLHIEHNRVTGHSRVMGGGEGFVATVLSAARAMTAREVAERTLGTPSPDPKAVRRCKRRLDEAVARRVLDVDKTGATGGSGGSRGALYMAAVPPTS